MSWNVFMNTCASTGDDDAVISHPFKPYTRERFPGAVLPPPTAEQRAAAEAPAAAHQQPQPQPQPQPQLQGGYVPAPQSVGSHVLIATAPSSSTSLSGHVMPQQLQLYQQQLYATAHNAPPGMYYQAPDEAGPADTDPTYYPQYQQQQQQHYPQYAYPYPYQQPAQMQQAMMAPAAPFINPYAQPAYAPGAYMYPTPYQYPYYPTLQQPTATAVPTATAAEMPDPHRPTYAQNIIGQEVAKRERIAALLSTRINNG